MKTLYLIFAGVKAFVTRSVFLFAVICVGIITDSLMFTYMYGLFRQTNDSEQGFFGTDAALALTMLLIYLLCVLAFLYLMVSVYSEIAHELNVYAILGASKRRIVAVVGGMMFVILAVLSAAAQAIHALLYAPLFSKLNVDEGFSYGFGDYFAIFLITLFSMYCFVFAFVYIKTSDTSLANYRNTSK